MPRAQITTAAQAKTEIGHSLKKYVRDPLGYVRWNWPDYEPRAWQEELLGLWGEHMVEQGFDPRNPTEVKAWRCAVVSGHGVGKSALTSWIIKFLLDTRPNSKGLVTATTSTQLRGRTWAELTKWHKRSITRHLGHITQGSKMLFRHASTMGSDWACSGETPTNPDAFQGTHAMDASPYGVFDEASGIPDENWFAFRGTMTDGEAHWWAFGNGTKSSGEFYRIFHEEKRQQRWLRRHVSGEDVKEVSREFINEIFEDFGRDSDMARVRVYGQFPLLGDLQFFDSETVRIGETIDSVHEAHMPLVMGVDVADAGEDKSVIYLRRGKNARDPKDENGNVIDHPIRTWSKLNPIGLAEEIYKLDKQYKIAYIFVDKIGLGSGTINDLARRNMKAQVVPVHMQETTKNNSYADMKTNMFAKVRERMRASELAIPSSLPPDLDDEAVSVYSGGEGVLRDELLSLEQGKLITTKGIKIAPTPDGHPSPDIAVALALTFRYEDTPETMAPEPITYNRFGRPVMDVPGGGNAGPLAGWPSFG